MLVLDLCCQSIVENCPDAYAKGYADTLRRMLNDDWPLGVIYTQALYVRNNLSHWRGDEAKRVRQELDRFIKENGK